MNLSSLFWDPDPYETDPLAFVVNQMLHAAVVGALPVALGMPVWLVLALFAAWEAAQVAWASGKLWDSLEDFGFVACGSLAVLWWPTAGIALVFLVAGAARRVPI